MSGLKVSWAAYRNEHIPIFRQMLQ